MNEAFDESTQFGLVNATSRLASGQPNRVALLAFRPTLELLTDLQREYAHVANDLALASYFPVLVATDRFRLGISNQPSLLERLDLGSPMRLFRADRPAFRKRPSPLTTGRDQEHVHVRAPDPERECGKLLL